LEYYILDRSSEEAKEAATYKGQGPEEEKDLLEVYS
jgi:hypothetical protein